MAGIKTKMGWAFDVCVGAQLGRSTWYMLRGTMAVLPLTANADALLGLSRLQARLKELY